QQYQPWQSIGSITPYESAYERAWRGVQSNMGTGDLNSLINAYNSIPGQVGQAGDFGRGFSPYYRNPAEGGLSQQDADAIRSQIENYVNQMYQPINIGGDWQWNQYSGNYEQTPYETIGALDPRYLAYYNSRMNPAYSGEGGGGSSSDSGGGGGF